MEIKVRNKNRPPLKYGWADTEQGIADTARALGIEYDHRMTYPKLKQLCFDRLIELKNERIYQTANFITDSDALAILHAVQNAGFVFMRVSADSATSCNPAFVLNWLHNPPPDPVAKEKVVEAVQAATKPRRKKKKDHKRSWNARYSGL